MFSDGVDYLTVQMTAINNKQVVRGRALSVFFGPRAFFLAACLKVDFRAGPCRVVMGLWPPLFSAILQVGQVRDSAVFWAHRFPLSQLFAFAEAGTPGNVNLMPMSGSLGSI